MNDDQRENLRLRLALEASQELAESRRLELAKLSRQLDELLRLASLQNEQLSDLRTMMRRKMAKQRKGAAEAPSDSEEDPIASNDATAPGTPSGDDKGSAPAPVKPPKTRKPRPKGAGRRPAPTHLATSVREEEVCACAHCGSKELLARDWADTKRIDAVATIARIRHDLVEVVRCKACGKTTTASPPPLPCEKAKFTCAFLAWVVTMKFALLVPLDRIRRLLASQGVVIAESTLVRLIELACDLGGPVDGHHWKQVKAAKCVLADATGLKVLVKGVGRAWDAYLDVFNADKVAVYQFAMTKHGDDLAALLKGFQGVVMCDADSRLNEIFRSEGVKRANCNAHPRRAFRDAEAVQPILAKEGGRFLAKMYAIERHALRDGLVGDALKERRIALLGPVAKEFRAWLEGHAGLLPSDLRGKAVRYYLRHFDDLTRFVHDPDIPIDTRASVPSRTTPSCGSTRCSPVAPRAADDGPSCSVWSPPPSAMDLTFKRTLPWMFERRGTWRKRYGLGAAELTPAAYQQVIEQDQRRLAA